MKPPAEWSGHGTATRDLSPTQLAALVRQHMRKAYLAGRPVAVEDYLRLFPQLSDQPDAVLDLIYCELLLRDELGGTQRWRSTKPASLGTPPRWPSNWPSTKPLPVPC
jgi:hypothetical protein